MPDEDAWQVFYDADCIINKLDCVTKQNGVIAEFGCGYGTFTLPVAKRTSGLVYAFDIEPELVALVDRKARAAGLANVTAQVRDFVKDGTRTKIGEQRPSRWSYNLLHIQKSPFFICGAFSGEF